MEARQYLFDDFEELLGSDFAGLAFIAAALRLHAGDAGGLVAVEPGRDGAPSKLAGMAFLVGKDHFTDGLDARLDIFARSELYGAEHFHFYVGTDSFHRFLLVGVSV